MAGSATITTAWLVLFALASAACALSPDIGWLITARTIQAVGAAPVAPLALTLLSAAFPPERRAGRWGILAGLAGLAGLATFSGHFIGGAIAEGLAWQWILWLNVPIGLVAAVLAHRRIAESVGPNRRSMNCIMRRVPRQGGWHCNLSQRTRPPARMLRALPVPLPAYSVPTRRSEFGIKRSW